MDHKKLVKAKTKECFAFAYQTDDNKLVFLVKSTDRYIRELKTSHNIITKADFSPKRKERSQRWYYVAIDNTWKEKQIYAMLDDLKAINERLK